MVELQIELQARLEKETPKNHLDMRHRLDREGKRWGKVIDYRQVKWVAVAVGEVAATGGRS